MTEQTEATYPTPVIHTKALIVVTVGKAVKKWAWGDARSRKEQAAAWLRAQPQTASLDIGWALQQKASEVPWTDGATFHWSGPAPLGLEYAAKSLLGVPEWGRGR